MNYTKETIYHILGSTFHIPLDAIEEQLKQFSAEELEELFLSGTLPPKEEAPEEYIGAMEDTFFSIWCRFWSDIPLDIWGKRNLLDNPLIFTYGRVFGDKEYDAIEVYVPDVAAITDNLGMFNISAKEILQWNNLATVNSIVQGSRLKITKPHSFVSKELKSVPPLTNREGEQLYCRVPFEYMTFANSNGEVFPCCTAYISYERMGVLQDEPIKEIWNSPSVQEFRNSIIDGSYRYCRKGICPSLANPEKELQTLEELDPRIRKAIEEEESKLSFGPIEINCGYDKFCNLSCPSCRTEVFCATDVERADIEKMQNRIKNESESVERLYLSGSGDPFASPYGRDLLDSITPEKFPRLQKIHLHSNGQLFTQKAWNALPLFTQEKIYSVEISIDGSQKESYEANRRGANYQRLLENLSFIAHLRKTGAFSKLKFSFVVQDNNYHEMGEFADFAKEYSCDEVLYTKIINWGTFTEEQFVEKAVHLQNHPKHTEFLEALHDPRLLQSHVYLGNLQLLQKKRI